MFIFHTNKSQYFNQQYHTTKKFIIPFIEDQFDFKKTNNVLEVGCDLGGNLKEFINKGCYATGVDINKNVIKNAKTTFKKDIFNKKITFICDDIFNLATTKSIKYDLIIVKDTIEHIHDHEKFIIHLSRLLSESGVIFFAFPPWQMPFGGHQQICKSKFISHLPWVHLLPLPIYKKVLKLFKETDSITKSLIDTKVTRINIEKFNKLINNTNLKVLKTRHYLINPNYEIKFNLKTKVQYRIISKTPYLRNFFTSTCYYIISK